MQKENRVNKKIFFNHSPCIEVINNLSLEQEAAMETKEKAENLYRKANPFILTCVGADGYSLTKAVVPGKYRESLEES